MNKMLRNAIFISCCLVAFSMRLFSQGLYWESKETVGRNGEERIAKFYAMPKMFKADQGNGHTAIIRLDKDEIVSVDNAQKTYSVMTFDQMEEMMKNLRGQGGAMSEEMQKRLEQMPPDQRKMVEDMMKRRGGMNNDTNFTVNKTEETKEIAGYPATKYVVQQGDKDFATVWASDNVPGTDELRKNLQDFRSRLASMTPGGGRGMGKWMKDIQGFPLAVETDFYNSTVTKVEQKSTPASAFDIPSGYTKKDMKDMMRRPGRGDRKPPGSDEQEKKDDKKNDENGEH